MDTLGWIMRLTGDAGDWRLTLDGVGLPANRLFSQNFHGWYMMPFNLLWFIQSLEAGSHTLAFQTARYGSSNEMIHGWTNGGIVWVHQFFDLCGFCVVALLEFFLLPLLFYNMTPSKILRHKFLQCLSW